MSNTPATRQDIAALTERIYAGTATADERGVAVKLLQTALSSTLIVSLERLNADTARISALSAAIADKIKLKLEEDMETLSLSELMNAYSFITSKHLSVLDLQRKVAQGKDLFPSLELSEDERMVLRLFSSFQTPEDKQTFITLAKKSLSTSNEFDQVE